MKKALLWEKPESDVVMVDSADVVKKIYLADEVVYKFATLDVNPENEALLDSLLSDLNSCEDTDEIEELLNSKGLKWELAKETEICRNILCFFRDSQSIGYLDDCETYYAFEYLDSGSNFKDYSLDEDMSETVVEYDDEHSENLDEWDGNNFNYIHQFDHARKYPIISIDGEKVEGKYLIEEWSQYQGSLPTGKIVDADWTVEQEKEERMLKY